MYEQLSDSDNLIKSCLSNRVNTNSKKCDVFKMCKVRYCLKRVYN